MDILGTLGDVAGLAGSGVAGGILGLVGNMATKALGIWQAHADTAKQLALADINAKSAAVSNAHDLEMLRAQIQQGQAATDDKLREIAAQGSQAGLVASIKADADITGAAGWVADVKALVRPVLTLGLVIILVWLVARLMSGDMLQYFSQSDVRAMVRDIVQALIFSTTTAIVWWFGDRTPRNSAGA